MFSCLQILEAFLWFVLITLLNFFFSSIRRHTRLTCDWSSDVCSSDLLVFRALCKNVGGVMEFGREYGQGIDRLLWLLWRSEERRVGKECCGKRVKLMVLALICLGNNRQD